jgi:hypothetical protein
MIKRIFGYIFIVISVLLLLVTLGRFQSLLNATLGLVRVFNGTLTAYELGYTVTTFVLWVLDIVLIVFLMSIGTRWIKGFKNNLNYILLNSVSACLP